MATDLVRSHLDRASRARADAHPENPPDLPSSPLGYPPTRAPFRRESPEPGSPRDRYLRDVRARQSRRDEERERVLSRVEDDKRSGPWCNASGGAATRLRARRHSHEAILREFVATYAVETTVDAAEETEETDVAFACFGNDPGAQGASGVAA